MKRRLVLFALVASVAAACTPAAAPELEPLGPGDTSTAQIVGNAALRFEPSETTVTPDGDGFITVQLASGGARHNLVLELDAETDDDDRQIVEAAAGEIGTGSLQLAPGTYPFYCDVAGHREAGMVGVLTVADPAPNTAQPTN